MERNLSVEIWVIVLNACTRVVAGSAVLLALQWLAGCSSTAPVVSPPTWVPPQPSQAAYVERVNNGAIFQPALMQNALFSSERKPRHIGDTLKIDIEEKLSANRKLNTTTERENEVATKGPGNGGGGAGLLKKLLNLDAKAKGSDAYTGKGTADNSTQFSGQLAASVINVLPNGHLVVAGERSIALNGGASTLRFSGVVNPADIKAGNIVASADVVNARVELAGEGDLQDTAGRTWLQRFLTDKMQIW